MTSGFLLHQHSLYENVIPSLVAEKPARNPQAGSYPWGAGWARGRQPD